LREALASYHQSEDLIQLGAYVGGSNPVLDRSIQMRPDIMRFLRQDAEMVSPYEQTVAELHGLAARLSAAK
jgi:flagellar biosynthesis/type III secretory pathway ATPase